MDRAQAQAIADTVKRLWTNTITFEGGDVVERFMSLYPDTGRVVSAASGAFTTTRDSLRAALANFWDAVGKNMRRPRWVWGRMDFDVLSRDAVVGTAQYTVPHWTPDGAPHLIGGAWTAVWSRASGRWVITQEHLSDLPRAIAQRLEQSMPRLADTSKR
jgi:hypothetical protein